MLRLGLGLQFVARAVVAAVEAAASYLLTEGGDTLTTEAGDRLILE